MTWKHLEVSRRKNDASATELREVFGRRLEDEKDNERIRREQQAEEARCSWLGSWISSLNPGNMGR